MVLFFFTGYSDLRNTQNKRIQSASDRVYKIYIFTNSGESIMKSSANLTIVILTSLVLLVPAATQAADMSIGVTTWYAWWDYDQADNNNEFDPALMYGPVLSLGFMDRWSISAVLLYGSFEDVNLHIDYERYDSDVALNYRISSYLKVFAGSKYLYVDVDSGESFHHVISPSLGISLTVPLGQSLFLLGSLSGLYGWGKEEGSLPAGDEFTSDLNEKGFNSTLSLAWYIDSMSTTVSIGGRYQRAWTTYDNELISDATHSFYGLTFGAVYSFGL